MCVDLVSEIFALKGDQFSTLLKRFAQSQSVFDTRGMDMDSGIAAWFDVVNLFLLTHTASYNRLNINRKLSRQFAIRPPIFFLHFHIFSQ